MGLKTKIALGIITLSTAISTYGYFLNRETGQFSAAVQNVIAAQARFEEAQTGDEEAETFRILQEVVDRAIEEGKDVQRFPIHDSTNDDIAKIIYGMKLDIRLDVAMKRSINPAYNKPAFDTAEKIANYTDGSGWHDYASIERRLKVNKIIADIGEDTFKERFGFNKEAVDLLREGNIVLQIEGPDIYDSSVEDKLAQEQGIQVTQVAAFATVQGWKPVTQAELIQKSAYFLPVKQPYKVDEECLAGKVANYNSKKLAGVGTAPKVKDGVLQGFAVWTDTVGGGYSWMNDDIVELGKACEVAAQ